MNKFGLKVVDSSVSEGIIIIDGYKFINASLIELTIDNISSWTHPDLRDGIVVLSELLNSLKGDGRYLIFTSVTGIADDGGWDGVRVSYDENIVTWILYIENKKLIFNFDRKQYHNEIIRVNTQQPTFPLEPINIFLPEIWDYDSQK